VWQRLLSGLQAQMPAAQIPVQQSSSVAQPVLPSGRQHVFVLELQWSLQQSESNWQDAPRSSQQAPFVPQLPLIQSLPLEQHITESPSPSRHVPEMHWPPAQHWSLLVQ
jgi:hypothetical protein